jgi:LDH2 family malate/lactate/ureidoglycolate dehydrogenase
VSERRYASDALQPFTHGILRALGAPPDVADEVARHLVRANLSGQDSHGVLRLPQYAGQAERGELVPGNRPRVVKETTSTALVDAQRGFGHYAAHIAVDIVSRKAREHGLAGAAIRHSTHVGRLGEFAERCQERGLVLLMTVGMAGPGVGGVVAHGGRERFFGSNVWAIGVPGTTNPMVFDGSMSSIAVGKVLVAKAAGHALQPECLVDRAGRPSVDPDDYFAGGAVLPLGGAVAAHKGFGLGLAAALLGGLSMIGDDAPTLAGASAAPGAPTAGRMAGVFVIAIDPEAFGGVAPYRALVEDCLAALRAVAPAPGGAAVTTPGERSAQQRRERELAGIPLAASTTDELAVLAARLGVAMPEALAA